MIPEEQTANTLAMIQKDQARLAELEVLFAAANDAKDAGAVQDNTAAVNGVMSKAQATALKEERRLLARDVKAAKRRMRERRNHANHGTTKFGHVDEAMVESSDDEAEGLAKWERLQTIDEQLKRHVALDAELKKLRARIEKAKEQKST